MEQEHTWEDHLQAGEAAIDSDDYRAARKHLLSALEMLEDAGEGDLADLARVTDQLAHAEWFDGDYTAAEESFGRLVVMQEGMCGPDSLEGACPGGSGKLPVTRFHSMPPSQYCQHLL